MADRERSKKGSDQVDGRTNRACAPCGKENKNTTADVFCKDCKQYQCTECAKVHQRFDFMSGHDIVDANQVTLLGPAVDMKGLDICDKHKKQQEFFCVDHQILCCSSCAIVEHRSCKEVNEISTHAAKADPQPDAILQALFEAQSTANKILNFIQESNSNARETSQLEPLLSLIDDIKNSFVQKCDALKTKIRDRVRQSQSTRRDEITRNVIINRDILQEAEKYHEILASVFEHGTREQKFIALQATEQIAARHKTNLKNQQASLYKLECSVEYSKLLNDLLQTSEDLASVVINQVNFDPDIPAVEVPRQLKLVATVELKQGGDNTEEPYYSGMDFFSDGRLAVIDNENCKLNIHDTSLQVVGMFKFSDYRQDVCVVSEDEVAVTSGRGYIIELLHVSKTSVITLTRTVETTAWYDSICMMNETTFLVSTFKDKRPMRMITMTGEEDDFTNLPEKRYNLDDSRSTYIRGKDKLVLTDWYAHEVHLYDNNDVLTRCVVTDDRIKAPRGVCVGPDDCLYVCSEGTNSIVQVSSSGRVIASHELDMKYPCSVCISKDGKTLAVSNTMTGEKKLKTLKIL